MDSAKEGSFYKPSHDNTAFPSNFGIHLVKRPISLLIAPLLFFKIFFPLFFFLSWSHTWHFLYFCQRIEKQVHLHNTHMQVLSDLKKAKLMGLNTGWPYLQGSPASAPMFEPYHHMSVWTRTKDSHGVSQVTPLFCLLTLPLFEMIWWSAQLTSQSWAGLGTKFFMFPKNPCLIPLFKFFFFST